MNNVPTGTYLPRKMEIINASTDPVAGRIFALHTWNMKRLKSPPFFTSWVGGSEPARVKLSYVSDPVPDG